MTATLICWDEAVTEPAHVSLTAILEQPLVGGVASLEATCAAEPQALTLAVASVTGHAFRPGPVAGFVGVEVSTSKGGGITHLPIDQVLLPPQAGR